MLCISLNVKKHYERDPALFSENLLIVHYSNPALKKEIPNVLFFGIFHCNT